MKRMKVLVAVLLLATFLLTGCSQLPPVLVGISPVVPAAEEGPSALAPEAADNSPAPQPAKAAPNALTKDADGLFRAKFEGSSVAGSGEVVDGKYRFTATNTDGEAWHVKLESN